MGLLILHNGWLDAMKTSLRGCPAGGNVLTQLGNMLKARQMYTDFRDF